VRIPPPLGPYHHSTPRDVNRHDSRANRSVSSKKGLSRPLMYKHMEEYHGGLLLGRLLEISLRSLLRAVCISVGTLTFSSWWASVMVLHGWLHPSMS
jgi:hypothetical protein